MLSYDKENNVKKIIIYVYNMSKACVITSLLSQIVFLHNFILSLYWIKILLLSLQNSFYLQFYCVKVKYDWIKKKNLKDYYHFSKCKQNPTLLCMRVDVLSTVVFCVNSVVHIWLYKCLARKESISSPMWLDFSVL